MQNQNWFVLVPAYGRDYTTAKAAREAFDSGADWQDARTGQYCTKSELPPGASAELRFNNHRGLAVVKVGGVK